MSPPIHPPQPVLLDQPASGSRKRLRSSDMFGDAQEILIEHAGAEYRLRITRQGKLILTK